MLWMVAINKDSAQAVRMIRRKERLRKACFSMGDSGMFNERLDRLERLERRDGDNMAIRNDNEVNECGHKFGLARKVRASTTQTQ
jgi:hypothetical protein